MLKTLMGLVKKHVIIPMIWIMEKRNYYGRKLVVYSKRGDTTVFNEGCIVVAQNRHNRKVRARDRVYVRENGNRSVRTKTGRRRSHGQQYMIQQLIRSQDLFKATVYYKFGCNILGAL